MIKQRSPSKRQPDPCGGRCDDKVEIHARVFSERKTSEYFRCGSDKTHKMLYAYYILFD